MSPVSFAVRPLLVFPVAYERNFQRTGVSVDLWKAWTGMTSNASGKCWVMFSLLFTAAPFVKSSSCFVQHYSLLFS